VRGHGAKQKIAITYVANATAHRLPAALELSLAGLKSGAHTLKVTISYTEASNKHGHKASTLTKTLQAKFTVC